MAALKTMVGLSIYKVRYRREFRNFDHTKTCLTDSGRYCKNPCAGFTECRKITHTHTHTHTHHNLCVPTQTSHTSQVSQLRAKSHALLIKEESKNGRSKCNLSQLPHCRNNPALPYIKHRIVISSNPKGER